MGFEFAEIGNRVYIKICLPHPADHDRYIVLLSIQEIAASIMKKNLVSAAMLALVCIFSGCTVIKELPPETGSAVPDAEYELGRHLLEAFLSGDGEEFVSLLPEEAAEKFGVKEFEASRKALTESLGEPISFSYVTELELPVFTPHIWKVRFRRQDLRSGETFTSEALFRVITGKIDDRPIITAFQFL